MNAKPQGGSKNCALVSPDNKSQVLSVQLQPQISQPVGGRSFHFFRDKEQMNQIWQK
jgi:hypothetical protein